MTSKEKEAPVESLLFRGSPGLTPGRSYFPVLLAKAMCLLSGDQDELC